jgi:serine protease
MRNLVYAAGACALAVGCGQAPAENKAGGSGEQEALVGAVIHPTVEHVIARNEAARVTIGVERHGGGGGGGTNLSYHGGVGGVGVETNGGARVYLVYWGSQWASDPSGEAAIQQSFFSHVGGSSWNASVTQYCEGVASGTVFCNGAGTAATNPSRVLAGVWYDNASAAPSRPSQSQLASEAVRAASHFGNTAAGSNDSVQYVINTASGNNSRGFGTQYCAYHSSTSSSFGNIAYTNMPYITDAGGSCGAGFNGLGPNAGITIVGGHEFAETESDQFPNGGWLDGSGAENGDKCAWISSGQGASASVDMSGASFPVQSLWSNAFNGGAGGCVLSYP